MYGGKPRLNDAQRQRIAIAYRDELVSMQQLAAEHGVSRQTIYAAVIAAGIDPRKCSLVKRRCGHCKRPIKVQRCRARLTRRSYCSDQCYYAHLGTSGYTASRHGQRIARRTIERYFELDDLHVVHHKDGDQRHNDPSNLMVFANQADHMRWHRGGGEASGAVPLWRGDR